ncbi:hypothetical protein V6N12_042762 [Hibiscus sabdariffa]|uniref:Uncharacterized protein n=1 Tax=Hibiscus sabdariffa TaxID=183260 RepID=A0ABR2B1L4_9ROSI
MATPKCFKFFNILHNTSIFLTNGYTSDLALTQLDGRSSFLILSGGKTSVAFVSGEGNIPSSSGFTFAAGDIFGSARCDCGTGNQHMEAA